MEQMLFLVPVVGLLGLLFAVILRQQVVKEDPGTDKMREIADAIAEGANAFLASEYRTGRFCSCVILCHRFRNTELDYSRMFPCGKRIFHHGRLSGHERRHPRQQPYR